MKGIWIILAFVTTLLIASSTVASGSGNGNGNGGHDFTEQLLLRPLRDGHVLAHFQFDVISPTASSSPNHVVLFPKSLSQIIDRYGVRELDLSLTNGRWNTRRWGHHSSPSLSTRAIPYMKHSITPRVGPIGAQLIAWMTINDTQTASASSVRAKSIDQRWNGLQQSLAGIICASLNQIGHTRTTQPDWTFTPSSSPSNDESVEIRLGTLPREFVCTENLTPWTKLLPARNQAGLARLFNSLRLYDASFNSLQLHVRPILGLDGTPTGGLHLTQSLTVVLDAISLGGHVRADWSISSLLNHHGNITACPLSTHSTIKIHLPHWMKHRFGTSYGEWQSKSTGGSIVSHNDAAPSFDVTASPSTIYTNTIDDSIVLEYDLHASSISQSDNFGLTYRTEDDSLRHFVSSADEYNDTPSVLFNRYMTGHGQRDGQLNVEIDNRHTSRSYIVNYFDSLPWFLKPYFHRMSLYVNDKRVAFKDCRRFRFLPSEYRGSPAEIEFEMLLPPQSITRLVLEFEKAFLTINDYPPDVSRGFDIQSGVLVVSRHDDTPLDDDVIIYSGSSLVLLPSPDFSMPFNVIAFTSTVLAFFFGSMFNMLYSSPIEILKRSRGITGAKRLADRLRDRLPCCKSKSPTTSTATTAATASSSSSSSSAPSTSAASSTNIYYSSEYGNTARSRRPVEPS